MTKVALITGSTRGIGAKIAERLSQENFTVVINSASSKEEGERFAQSLANACYYQANVAEEEQCKTLIETIIARFGRLDVLVNNAAAASPVIPHEDLDAASDEIFNLNFNVNVMGPWYLSRAALPHLKASKNGVIINISSIAGSRPVGSSIPYAVSKAAVNQLTRLLAKVAAPEVRVNAIAPGFIETSRVVDKGFDQLRQKVKEHTVLKRTGTPEALAELALGIINCDYLTGEVIVADGGLLTS